MKIAKEIIMDQKAPDKPNGAILKMKVMLIMQTSPMMMDAKAASLVARFQ